MNNKFLKVLILVLIIVFVFWLCLFIGIDFSIRTLLLVMTIDYVIGISLAITGSSKHGDGKLSSKIGYKGLIKKITILLLVALGAIIDEYLVSRGISFEYIKDISIIAFIVNEIVSIIENSRLAGLKIPDVFTRFIEFLDNVKFNNKNKK